MHGKSAGSRNNVVIAETYAAIHRFIESIPLKGIYHSNNIMNRYLSSTLNLRIFRRADIA